jgi:CheY-like chemotaxis protein
MAARKILLVEDDHMQTDFIVPILQRAFSGSDIKLLKTEHEFRSAMEEIAKNPPDVIVIDVMLRWTNPAPNLPRAPEDVKTGGYYVAGIRCAKLLSENEKTNQIPVILYTVLETPDIEQALAGWPNKVHLLTKEPDIDALVDKIRQVTGPGH